MCLLFRLRNIWSNRHNLQKIFLVQMGSAASFEKETFFGVTREDFVFSSVIGEGGFSTVKSSMHIPTKSWMALKETDIKRICKHKKGLTMLATEVQILAALAVDDQHPFIVNLHFAFRDHKKCYLALDFHSGGDLRYHMRCKKVFSERSVALYAICLSSALNFVHERGILHRDVKPENVLLDIEGFPHLTDFGVSTFGDKKSEILCYGSSGTRQYLAPEVFTKSHRHGAEADFWSLGVMLFELVYGRRPFNKHCPFEMVRFQQDLQDMGVHLSSTSYKFCNEELITLEEVEDLAMGMPPSVLSSLQENKRSEETRHWLHVAFVTKNNPKLCKKLKMLKHFAEQDQAYETLDSASTTYSLRSCKKESCLPTRDHLPSGLRPTMPKYAKNSKRVSLACTAFLEGLMDIRVWCRLGAGNNFDLLKNHAWFDEVNLSWTNVMERNHSPAYLPNSTKVSRDISFKYNKKGYDTYSSCTTSAGQKHFNYLLTELSLEERNILENFHFVSPLYSNNEAIGLTELEHEPKLDCFDSASMASPKKEAAPSEF